MRQYTPIWEKIKKAKRNEVVMVRCHEQSAARVIQAVRKEKSREVALKKKLGMKYPSPLIVVKKVDPDRKDSCILEFSLSYNWNWL